MTSTYPRETVEFIPVAVTVNGVAVTTNVEFSLVPDGSRPTTWTTAATLSGAIGVLISSLTPGLWSVYARVSSAPETPVINCGTFIVE